MPTKVPRYQVWSFTGTWEQFWPDALPATTSDSMTSEICWITRHKSIVLTTELLLTVLLLHTKYLPSHIDWSAGIVADSFCMSFHMVSQKGLKPWVTKMVHVMKYPGVPVILGPKGQWSKG